MSESWRIPDEIQSLYILTPMRGEDIPQVLAIEQSVFPNPWPLAAFEHEVRENPISTPIVVRMADSTPSTIVGYCLKQVTSETVHILNVAVHPRHQRRGVGRTLLENALEAARLAGVKDARLEVRASNLVAQNLYKSMGFREFSRQKGYYISPKEDALLFRRDALDAGL